MRFVAVVLCAFLIAGCPQSYVKREQLKLDVPDTLLVPPAEFERLNPLEGDPFAISLAIRYNG